VSKDAYRHIFLTANMSHSAFAESKTMETFHPDMSTYVKSCTRRRPRKSKWCSHIVVSRRGQSFFLGVIVSLLRGQSSWSVVFRGWCFYFMVVMHTYLLRHMAGEIRGQCLDKCTGMVGRTRVGGHETRPKPKPNVDYYLVTYYYYCYC